MGVRPENTPNPNAIKFTTDKMIFEGNDSVSVMPGEESEHEILTELMQLEDVCIVVEYQHFLTVNQLFHVEWDHIMDQSLVLFVKHGYAFLLLCFLYLAVVLMFFFNRLKILHVSFFIFSTIAILTLEG